MTIFTNVHTTETRARFRSLLDLHAPKVLIESLPQLTLPQAWKTEDLLCRLADGD